MQEFTYERTKDSMSEWLIPLLQKDSDDLFFWVQDGTSRHSRQDVGITAKMDWSCSSNQLATSYFDPTKPCIISSL